MRKAESRAAPDGDASAASQRDVGAATVASVLSAVDEDQEDDDEARMPDEFDYHSDGEGSAE